MITKWKMTLAKEPEEITCDRCGNATSDRLQMQEFLIVNKKNGYGNSAFGDQTRIEADICQACIAKVMGDFIRVADYNEREATRETAERLLG